MRAFDARLQKGDSPGAWTCVLMDDVRLPVKAALRKAIGKEAGATVHVRIDERIG